MYHDNPADVHAPDAIYAVAELLGEQGHELGDAASTRAAVGQYEFLRTQYPGSRLREPALVAEARLERDELHDPAAAKERYRLAVKEAPHSESAAVARTELAGLSSTEVLAARPRPEPAAHGLRLTDDNARLVDTAPAPAAKAAPAETVEVARPEVVAKPVSSPARRSGPLAQVTGIRHWSTPTYTRVAIDLGDEVTFEAARVPNPDRIYFDLHGARLAAELVGKSFDVTDDGFLKKIRAAQAPGDVTRVVLDVNDVTEYSAFLLPNPYRLIIDIHGAAKGARTATQTAKAEPALPYQGQSQPAAVTYDGSAEVPVAPAAARQASAAANVSGLPATAPTDRTAGASAVPIVRAAPAPTIASPTIASPTTASEAPGNAAADVPGPRTGVTQKATVARPVPNTVTVKAPETSSEVAAVSGQPGRVDATHAPTTRPIAAVVKPVNLGSSTVTADATPAPDLPVRKGRKGAVDSAPAKAAEPTAEGETSLVRALGLKIGRIVIDAGHGGHDSGTLGVDGIEEKDVVLDVALRLGKLLHERLGAEIIYTRSDDTFIPLETRTAIANKAQADLFLSIHANSSQDASARGVETYYLNFTSDPTALDVAARENAVGGQSIHQLSDLVKKITLKDKIAESREFATDVEGSLYAGLQKGNDGLKNRGVKKAPFVVLIGANMPSILAEISFVTNAKDAAELREPEYRQRVAESLYAGVARYENGLSGGRPAQGSGGSVRAAIR